MRQIKKIIWHCSASPDGVAKSRDQIEREHRARGFRKIGYHWLIQPDGTRVRGRPELEVGAHTEGHNKDSIGVCMIGTGKFTKATWDEADKMAKEYDARFPGVGHGGHRDFSPDLNGDGKITKNEWIKLCPGFDVAEWRAKGPPPKAIL